jgi:poly-gamma-glutamate synthesis protein (capsule biosynthesis protein)
MTGRGIDQALPHSCPPRLYEEYVSSALDYLGLAEQAHGPIPWPLGYADVWGAAAEVLEERRPDARVINLETSVTTSEDALPKGINYRMHPANVPILTAARIDCCVLANNHVLDWGEAGLLETLETLAAAAIPTAGAGRELGEAQRPAVIDVAGACRVLVFAFAAMDSGVPSGWAAGAARPGVHLLANFSAGSVHRIARLVEAEKRPGDLVVASVHWGSNWGFEIPGAHHRFAHALIDDAGVDVVHGHSSHHAKAVEVYHDRPILYGCGDLLNDYEGIRGREPFRDDLVLMYFPACELPTGRLVSLRMTPLRIRGFRLHHAAPAEAAWLTVQLDRECRRFGHRVELRDGSLWLDRD